MIGILKGGTLFSYLPPHLTFCAATYMSLNSHGTRSLVIFFRGQVKDAAYDDVVVACQWRSWTTTGIFLFHLFVKSAVLRVISVRQTTKTKRPFELLNFSKPPFDMKSQGFILRVLFPWNLSILNNYPVCSSSWNSFWKRLEEGPDMQKMIRACLRWKFSSIMKDFTSKVSSRHFTEKGKKNTESL